MNDIKNETMSLVACDKFEIPIILLKNMKREMFDVASKFMNPKKENFKLQAKVLSNGRYLIEVKFFADNFVFK